MEVVSVCLAASKAGKCDGRANGRGTKANRLSFPDSGPARIHRKGYFWQEFKGREMYGRKKLQKENEANLSRLADSDTTKKFEDEPAERKRLTALRHGKWKILYLIFRVKKR